MQEIKGFLLSINVDLVLLINTPDVSHPKTNFQKILTKCLEISLCKTLHNKIICYKLLLIVQEIGVLTQFGLKKIHLKRRGNLHVLLFIYC